MLEAKDVTIEAGGGVLVEHLSFVAKPGEVTRLEGIGAGASTAVARALLGLWPVASGYVTFCCEPLTAQSAPWLRRQMAYVPQALPDGRDGGPVALACISDALRQVDVREKRVVVVECADDVAMPELQQLADAGLAVVIIHNS